MTTLISKFQEITKRLQQLTVWRPSEQDPFYELDHWRTDAHATIEQIYIKKRQQIEQLMDKHEREFMRQIARQRLLLNSIRKRLIIEKENNSHIRTQNETSILTDLQKIENDINIKLGRAEILIKIIPLNIENTILISLKTYLSGSSTMYYTEMSTRNQQKKLIQRSKDEISHGYDSWLQTKKKEEVLNRNRLKSAKQKEQYTQENELRRQKDNEASYYDWLERKKAEGAFNKKKLSVSDNELKDESIET